MTAIKKFNIEKNAQGYIRGQLYAMVYNYLTGSDFTDQALAYREALTVYWRADRVNTNAYIFLMNFVCWLDNDEQFSVDEDRMYQEFCFMMQEEMEADGWFDGDEYDDE